MLPGKAGPIWGRAGQTAGSVMTVEAKRNINKITSCYLQLVVMSIPKLSLNQWRNV
jgi:hypothetical protein